MSRLKNLIYLSHLQPSKRNYDLQGGEQELAVSNPSIFKSRLFFLVFLIGNGAAASFVQTAGLVVSGGLVAVTALVMIIEYIRVRQTYYFVTNRRAIVVSNFLRPSVTDMEYTDLDDLDENQTWIQSLFNVGTIKFESYDGQKLRFKSVYNLRELERAVYTALPEPEDMGESDDLSSVISSERLQNAEDDRLRRE